MSASNLRSGACGKEAAAARGAAGGGGASYAGCRLPFDALKCEMEAVTVNLRQRANKVSCRLFAFWFLVCIPAIHTGEGYYVCNRQ